MISYQVEFGSVGVSHSNYPQTATKPLILLQTMEDGQGAEQARIAMTVNETLDLIKRLEDHVQWAKKFEKKRQQRVK